MARALRGVLVASSVLALGGGGSSVGATSERGSRVQAGVGDRAEAAASVGLRVRNAAGGPITAVAGAGPNLAWVGAGVTLSAYDLTAPEYPQRTRQLQTDPGANIRSLALAPHRGPLRVYAGTDRGLYVVDPGGAPPFVGRVDTYGPVSGVAAASTECRLGPACWSANEHRLYLSDASYGLLVADTTGTLPVVVAGFPVSGGLHGPAALGDGSADSVPFVLLPGEHLIVLSAGEAVAYAAELDLGGRIAGVAANHTAGFASVVGVGLVVLDLHDPAVPVVQATLPGVPPGQPLLDGPFLWLTGTEVRLIRFEEGWYRQPVDAFGGPGPYLGISAAADAALGGPGLLAAAGDQLSIVDTSTDSPGGPPGALNPRLLSTVPAIWPMLSIAAAGDYALVAKGMSGLDVVGMEGAPEVVISYLPPGGVFGVTAEGGIAYLATGEGAQVLDVSRPDQPVLGATFGADWAPTSWIASSSNAVVAAYVDSVHVADLGGGAPTDAGNLTFADLPDWPAGAVVQGVAAAPDAAYLAAGSAGVIVLDLTDRARPRIGRRLGVDGDVTGVAAAGRWMGAVTANGWALFDVTRPLSPELIEREKTGAAAHDIALAGDLMWVADDRGVTQRDLTDAALPERRFRGAQPARAVVSTSRGALTEAGAVVYSLEAADLPDELPTATASAVPTGWPSPVEPTATASPTREPTPSPSPDGDYHLLLPWVSAARH